MIGIQEILYVPYPFFNLIVIIYLYLPKINTKTYYIFEYLVYHYYNHSCDGNVC